MNRLCRKLLLLAACICPALHAAPTRVACVGDSITYGMGVAARETNSYPARLQQRADREAPGQYEVRNFGVSAMTLMRGTSKSYWDRPEYCDSLAFAADIVIIMLGTNDSNGEHRDRIAAQFEADYRALIASYRAGRRAGEPRIIVMLPPRCHLEGEGLYDPHPGIIRDTLAPLIRRVAADEGLELIDLHDALGREWQRTLMPDRLHPSAAGAALLEAAIAPIVLKPRP